ncbi:MAG: ribonuclease J [Anaerolineae bacterium CG2_30_64_16]|nr:MAG: ribonuclease J [Anaerolineae bacterium CG2_30_64_16]
MSELPLRIVPLGGFGEIGKNLMVLEYDQDILVIDAGLMFPEDDMLGIDLVYPDITYLTERAERVLAVILTHGHEDHIGALPYLLKYLDIPVYATPLTRGLAEIKLKEAGLLADTEVHTIKPDDVLKLGCFTVEFFHVCHSIPDAVGLAVTTPVGLVVHASDYKFDQHPVDGKLTDVEKLRELGERGVLLLLSDSTNADTEGFTPSEQRISETLHGIMAAAPGRVIVATFASNISRVQQVIQVARHHGRRVGVIGRSMVNNVRMAIDLGYLDIGHEDLLSTSEMNDLFPERVVIVCTGSQGEPSAVLARMASDEHPQLQVTAGDTVVLSAEAIPGNEESVNRIIDDLFRLGANVIYQELSDVHVSGHGSREDHKLMLSLTRPRFFIPMHGEYRHLVLHARTARMLGIPQENITIIESGQVVEVRRDSLRLAERVNGGHVLVDGLSVGDVGSVVLRDRKYLSRDGFLVAMVALNRTTGEVVADPEILTRGFVYVAESEDLIEGAKDRVWEVLESPGAASGVRNRIKDALRQYCYAQTGRRPLILPLVLEV